MKRKIFFIFLLSIFVCSTAVVVFIQSERFADICKKKIHELGIKDLGIDINFERLSVGLLPPSVSLINVDVKVNDEKNALNLRAGSQARIGRLGLSFRMLQGFSRGFNINKFFLSDADITILLNKSDSKKPKQPIRVADIIHQPLEFSINERFYLSIRQVELRNSRLLVNWPEDNGRGELSIEKIQYLAITPSRNGTNLVSTVEKLQLKTGSTQESFGAIKTNIDAQSQKVDVSLLEVQRKEAVLHMKGKISGPIDKLPENSADLTAILRAPIHELTDFEKKLANVQGAILAELKVTGLVKDPQLKGRIEIDGLKHSLWDLDKVTVQGTFSSKLVVVEGATASKGLGQVSLTNRLEVPLPLAAGSYSMAIKLQKAKFEDFAGDVRKSVNNLRAEIDGTLDAKLDLASATDGKAAFSAATLKLAFDVRDLELNNQTYGKNKPYRRLFRVAPGRIEAALSVGKDGLRVQNGRIIFSSGALDLKGSVLKGKGFDLSGTSDFVNLGQELGQIGDIQLKGEGAFGIHAHGPDDAVKIDFDLKQKNARFVEFDFGELDGRVTYDDEKSYVYVKNLKGKKNKSEYVIDGRVNVGQGDDLSLAAKFMDTAPDDLFAIFAKKIEKITWIPHGMQGKLQGEAKVGGGYDKGLNSLKIDAQFLGTNLTYKGETIQQLDANAGVDLGTIYARNVVARKYGLLIRGEVKYSSDDVLDYWLETERGKLRSMDFISSAGLPIDGIMKVSSKGRGKWDTLESESRFDLQNAFVRTKPMPNVSARYVTKAGASSLFANIGTDLSFEMRGVSSQRQMSTGDVQLNSADLSFLLCLLNKKSCNDPNLAFTVNGSGKISWPGNNWRAMDVNGIIKGVQIAKDGFSIRSSAPFSVGGRDGLVESAPFQMDGEGTQLQVQLKGAVDGSKVDNSIRGRASLKLLEFINPLIEEATGKFDFGVSIMGSIDQPNFQGQIAIQDGFLRLSGLDAPVDALSGKLRLAGTRVTVENFGGQLGGGTVQLSGGIDLYLKKAPRFGLDLFLANNRLKFFPVNYAEFSDARLSFTGDRPPYLFGGTARVKRVMMRNNFNVGGQQKALRAARYLPENVNGSKAFYEIKIKAIADGGVFVQNDTFDAEFSGELTLLNNFEYPQILARAELVRGRLLFRTTPFTLDHAIIRNQSPEIFNPEFSIGGMANVDNYRINLFAAGTIDQQKITLSSSPSMAQEDIISLLVFGFKGEEAKRINPNDTNVITYSEVSSILLEQLRLSQNLQSKGIKVHVAPAINESKANIIRQNTTPGTVSPKVYLQTQIMKNLDATFGSTVGATQGQQMDASLEYKVGKKASINAVYEQGTDLDAAETRNSVGADLKFRWGFK